LNNAGTARCWGINTNGQTTVPASLSSGAIAVACGYQNSCGINATGSAFCWGLNANSQSTIPATLGTVTAIAPGYQHTW
jgi:alpha-tubulin suppressor-like RCC1 family protein